MKPSGDIIIVGAGIAGLHLATLLQARNADFRLIETRPRVGGRVLTERGLDLGPSWFWPQQSKIVATVQRHGLQVFQQHDSGDLIYDNGEQVRRLPGQRQAPSIRLRGGMGALVYAMLRAIDEQRLQLDTRLVAIHRCNEALQLQVESSTGQHTLSCRRVVLTLPPRLLARTVEFDPPPGDSLLATWGELPTWMASHAKAVMTYSEAFWRDQGLSGDAFSQRGPLGEVHDASTDEVAALSGFFSWPYAVRSTRTDAELKNDVRGQLALLFGERAGDPLGVDIKDWTADSATATERDRPMLNYHPVYGLPSQILLDGRVILAGTETDEKYGGYLEGALASAERALSHLDT